MKILIIHGPNLNMLGTREPEIYGSKTLDDINQELIEYSNALPKEPELTFFQSNTEGEIVSKIQEGINFDGIIINPAAYTHTSVAIQDALKAIKTPAVEVHLSNIFAREDFRSHSYISPACLGVISGFGSAGYKMALYALTNS